MTAKELMVGRVLYYRVNSIYGMHPEYKKLNAGVDRFEKFVIDMSEKYNLSRSQVISQIKYAIGE